MERSLGQTAYELAVGSVEIEMSPSVARSLHRHELTRFEQPRRACLERFVEPLLYQGACLERVGVYVYTAYVYAFEIAACARQEEIVVVAEPYRRYAVGVVVFAFYL